MKRSFLYLLALASLVCAAGVAPFGYERGPATSSPALRVATLTDAATVTPTVDAYDAGILTTLSQTTTIANPTGAPVQMQRYTLRIKSTTSRALTWGDKFRGSTDLALPSATTGSSLTDYCVFVYNSTDTKWDLAGKTFGF